MESITNYIQQLSPMGWTIGAIFSGLLILALYSQFRKRESDVKRGSKANNRTQSQGM